MNSLVPKKTVDYIMPLLINKMRGRMLRIPAAKKNNKQEILVVYGHHASLERIFGIADELSRYGAVTAIDLPGFGGMDSLYRIDRQPSLNILADYLAAYMKLRYRKRRLVIVGMSFGFAVVTRTLQRHPDLATNVDLAVSLVGFVHKDDFVFKKSTIRQLKLLAWLGSHRFAAILLRRTVLTSPVIKAVYKWQSDKHPKLINANAEEKQKRINYEVQLWHMNDIRTQLFTLGWMVNLDLCRVTIKVPVAHVSTASDRYIDSAIVEQHLGVIYENVSMHRSTLKAHAPTIIATADEAAKLIPRSLRSLLRA